MHSASTTTSAPSNWDMDKTCTVDHLLLWRFAVMCDGGDAARVWVVRPDILFSIT